MGRPKSDDPQSFNVMVRLTREESDLLSILCEKNALSRGGLLRWLLTSYGEDTVSEWTDSVVLNAESERDELRRQVKEVRQMAARILDLTGQQELL